VRQRLASKQRAVARQEIVAEIQLELPPHARRAGISAFQTDDRGAGHAVELQARDDALVRRAFDDRPAAWPRAVPGERRADPVRGSGNPRHRGGSGTDPGRPFGAASRIVHQHEHGGGPRIDGALPLDDRGGRQKHADGNHGQHGDTKAVEHFPLQAHARAVSHGVDRLTSRCGIMARIHE
jgi:hypothetical protein